MNTITYAVAKTIIDDRLRQAEMRHVAKSLAPRRARREWLRVRLLDLLSGLPSVKPATFESDLP